MTCHLDLPGPCDQCRACGGGELSRRLVQLVRDEEACGPRCTLCARVRQMVGEGPISVMKYHSFRSSIDQAVTMCPTGALTLAEAPPRTD